MKKYIAIVLAVTAVAVVSFNLAKSPVGLLGGLEIGDQAPDFKLQNAVDGEWYSMDDFKDAKGLIITFTCNTCPYAQLYEDRLIALHNKMADKGYPVIAIQPNDPDVKPGDSMEEMKRQAETKAYPFPYLLDEGQKIYPKYGATRTPEIFLVDQNRVLRYTGAIDDSARDPGAVTVNYVEKAVNALERGEDPKPDLTKAIGCTIKTKS